MEPPLKTESGQFGILQEYQDVFGKVHPTSDRTRSMLLKAMGVQDGKAMEADPFGLGRFMTWLPPVQVVIQGQGEMQVLISLPQALHDDTFQWQLRLENGETHQGTFEPGKLEKLDVAEVDGERYTQYALPLPSEIPLGYHRFSLSVEVDDAFQAREMTLVVTPSQCYFPASLVQEDQKLRVWGPAVQLYALRSKNNWGIGDFADLQQVVDWCATEGAGIVGVNPLHALFPTNPAQASPYSPSSRMFWNILYINIESVPEYEASTEAHNKVLDEPFQAELNRIRQTDLVDYPAVTALKLEILEILYQQFRLNHMAYKTERAQEFLAFQAAGGDKLRKFALYEAIQERFHKDDPGIWGWPVWPERYKDPDGEAVEEFATANWERVEFYQYLQWLAESQLHQVGLRSLERHLAIGLYMDLAVGADVGGSEIWTNQSLYTMNASIGAPPDAYNSKGQNWGLPPMLPNRLYERAYQPFIDIIRTNMRYAGAIRIDHFMALLRLFWIPIQTTPDKGAYVRYPFEDLLAILALESQRNQCVVVGEDLGTVPDEVREKMAEWGILSYKVFFFEKNEDGEFKAPKDYDWRSLVTFSTHDLPTLQGFWHGEGIRVKTELDLFPSKAARKRQVQERVLDRWRFLAALERENLLPQGLSTDPGRVPKITPELCQGIYAYLARTPSILQMFQLEDVLEQLEQVNMPGTTNQYPNWQRKLPMPIEEFAEEHRLKDFCFHLRRERGRSIFTAPKPAKGDVEIHRTDIPSATYRFQFNRNFTFARATELIPYLSRLGVTHCYASPLLTSRPGSTHGYDIIDHASLNPEIGTYEEFLNFVNTLRAHQMGLILDIVPNHMGVGQDNQWWMDVLEDGPASIHSGYFDVDWAPLKAELHGKVLLPVLGEQYGKILEKGQFEVQFDAMTGVFTLHYYEHRWPINPHSYAEILNHRMEILAARLGNTNPAFLEYQSIITAFERLPKHTEREPKAIEERMREKLIARKRLADLCRQQPDITSFIAENVADFNDVVDNPPNQQRLNRLLEAQAYRLSHWRVATDEINYRRFFDINDLAGVCVENPKVFWDTHDFILKLVGEKLVSGLRIDHPDGLFDPSGYFTKLQEEASHSLNLEPGIPQSPEQYPIYLLVEKILAPYERLSPNWPVHGTTGYEFANSVSGLFVDKAHERQFSRIYQRFISHKESFHHLVHTCKHLIMKVSLASELNVLVHQLNQISETDWTTRDFTLNNLRNALAEVTACFPVYRTYVTPGNVSKKDREYVDWAVNMAKKSNPAVETTIFDFIRSVLLLEFNPNATDEQREAITRFAMKYQQFTGPVMAKSLEDTAFYRFNRLVSLNEVGGEPNMFGTSLAAFHQQNLERSRRFPHTMLATSTHDTKRSEDTRVRISVLSEIPSEWSASLKIWRRLNHTKKTELADGLAPSYNDEYLLYQALLGIWPLTIAEDEDIYNLLFERVSNYMLKAVREAKAHTSWINQNAEYEDALVKFIQGLLQSPHNKAFIEAFMPLQQKVAWFGMLNALSQTVLKFTSPGMPDIYQGTEMWDFSLVDPDNRRPVNYAERQQLHDQVQAVLHQEDALEARSAFSRQLLEDWRTGQIKLFLISATLHYRKQNTDLFQRGDYLPLEVEGAHADHVIAFARVLKDKAYITVAPRLACTLMRQEMELPVAEAVWKDTRIKLPSSWAFGMLRNVYTGEAHTTEAGGSLPVSVVLSALPVALLAAE